jgi:hypothetical protein
MKTIYRGCSIDVHREKSLGGWSEVYWSLFSPNSYEITSGFGGGTVREMVREMKETADLFLDKFKGNSQSWDISLREG